ncbi:DUF320 domain-containing protein, partial [Arthrobacter sp. PO-11]|nr:DUF320 domain-containing protein [Arthrobacter cavernae]
MHSIVRRGLLGSLLAGGLMTLGAAAANAADTTTTGQGGLLSGTQVVAPVNVPLTLGATSLSLLGDATAINQAPAHAPAYPPMAYPPAYPPMAYPPADPPVVYPPADPPADPPVVYPPADPPVDYPPADPPVNYPPADPASVAGTS